MNEFHLRATLSLRNNDMVSARERLGLTQHDLANMVPCSRDLVAEIEAMDYHRFGGRSGRYAPVVTQIADILGLAEDCIVPAELAGIKIESGITKVVDVDPSRLLGVSEAWQRASVGIEQVAEDRAALGRALMRLKARERMVINRRYLSDPPVTLDAVGKLLGVSRERVRQIENCATLHLQRILAPYVRQSGT